MVTFVTSNMIVLIKMGNGIYTFSVARADGVWATETNVGNFCSVQWLLVGLHAWFGEHNTNLVHHHDVCVHHIISNANVRLKME